MTERGTHWINGLISPPYDVFLNVVDFSGRTIHFNQPDVAVFSAANILRIQRLKLHFPNGRSAIHAANHTVNLCIRIPDRFKS